MSDCDVRPNEWGMVFSPKAITTSAHKHARIVYDLVKHGGEYIKKTEKQYAAEVRERLERSLHKKAKDLGYELVKTIAPPESPPLTA